MNEYDEYLFDMECQYEDPAWVLYDANSELQLAAMQRARELVDMLYEEMQREREYHECMTRYLNAR